jgi:surfeit locus 1 family protein
MGRVSVGGIAAAIGVVLVAAVCVRLGIWQLHRLEERRARNAELAAALAQPVLALEAEALGAVASDPGGFRFRRVWVEGRYDPTGTFLIRGRARGGVPGVHLITPLLLGRGDTTLLVNRGWLPAADAATADPRPYRSTGPVRLLGLLHPLLPRRQEAPALVRTVEGVEVRTYRALHAGVLGGGVPSAVLPVYLQLLPVAEGREELPYPEPLPRLDEGPHLGYAFQWFSFAAIAVIGFTGVSLHRMRRG